ncbi:MAG: glycosyltransferase family 39 protein, partial [Opitutae bacterium]|nr:glycosyltransferase family 39 protein [Opitutae bacterium]
MPLPSPPPARRARLLLGFAVLLALGHALLSLRAMRDKSTTSDELAHVTGGYTFDALDDYRLQPENGILPQRLHALPSVLAGVRYPAPAGRDWRESGVWQVGHQFFYELGNDSGWMLFTARAVNSLFGAATVLLVFGWARRLFGDAGAVVAGLFAAFSPTMLAHSALATSDMAMTFFFLASVGAYWRHLQTGGARSWALSAVVFGLACVAKYSAVLLLPMMAVMALV